MDPLSVTASIVGLLAAAGKVGETLTPVVSNFKDAPRAIDSVAAEVQDFRTILSSLQQFLLNLGSASPRRVALIQLDQVIVTLTDSVLTFSELEAVVLPLQAPPGSEFLIKSRFK